MFKTLTQPGLLLRGEGLALFGLSVLLYSLTGTSWWWFVGLLLVPDITMVGYLVNQTSGATLYNLGHFEALPAILGVFGMLSGSTFVAALALIWLAHIGMDRLLGYGLKYASGFKDTHLNRV